MLWIKSLKICLGIFLVIGLSFSSGLFGILLYGKVTGKALAISEVAAEVFRPGSIGRQVPGPNGEAADPVPVSPSPSVKPKPEAARLDEPAIAQHPELPSGCEVTSLAMLLQYFGVGKGKLELAGEMKVDPTPLKHSGGRIVSWGDPNVGFVGNVTGRSRGYGVYHGPIYELLRTYVGDRAKDLSGGEFAALEQAVADGSPVVVWTTINFRQPTDWVTWESPTGTVWATFIEHAVLMTGYDERFVYVNDPWTGAKDVAVDKERFVAIWEAMGRQAVTAVAG